MPKQAIGSLLIAFVPAHPAAQVPVAYVPGSDPSFAECVASAGDLDGDGKNDWLVADTTPGWVWAISGATSKPLFRLEGKSPHGAGFTNIASLGDVSGDHRPDILVSTGRHADMPVRVYSGIDGKLLYEVAAEWAALVGDVNGDGIADFVTSTVMPSGGDPDRDWIQFRLCSGSSGATIREVDRIERVGWAGQVRTFGLGDVNADGVSDWAALLPDKAVVFSGKSMAELLSLGARESIAPASICNAGDMDGDGRADALVAYPDLGDEAKKGEVVLHSGADRHAILCTGPRGCWFESTLFSLGSLHHDGVREFATISYSEWAGAESVSIWSGFPTSNARGLDPMLDIDGKGQGSVAVVPDVDGDGVEDLLVGLPWNNPRSRGTGIAHVYSGETLGLLRVLSLEKLRKQLESRPR